MTDPRHNRRGKEEWHLHPHEVIHSAQARAVSPPPLASWFHCRVKQKSRSICLALRQEQFLSAGGHDVAEGRKRGEEGQPFKQAEELC